MRKENRSLFSCVMGTGKRGRATDSAWRRLRLLLVVGLVALGACSQESSQPIVAKEPQAYKLIGIVQGDSKQAGAVFEDPQTKKQRLVQLGQMLGGATLTEIRREEVLLKRGEEVITLRLTIGSPAEYHAMDPIPVPAALRDPNQARQAVISKVIPPYDPQVEKAKRAVSRNEVDRFVNHFQDQLKNQAPVLVTTSVGMAVDLAHVDGDILRTFGLESTDRIVEINGMGVDSPDRFRQILDIMGKNRGNRGSVFNISVLRGEAIQPLYYGINPHS
jgi:type II secretory pathway component PulC